VLLDGVEPDLLSKGHGAAPDPPLPVVTPTVDALSKSSVADVAPAPRLIDRARSSQMALPLPPDPMRRYLDGTEREPMPTRISTQQQTII